MIYRTQAIKTNSQNFQNTFFCIFHISPSISILCQNILAEKLLQSTFCDKTLYITNVCRVIRRVTKVALLNNFQNESWCVLPAHSRIVCLPKCGEYYLFEYNIIILLRQP